MAICGQPIKSRPGQTCTNLASRDVDGVKCCGKHIGALVRKNHTRKAHDAPPPPSFVPFDCGICMHQCRSANTSCITICNHKFHKACLSKWEQRTHSEGKAFTCPMCRKELPSKTSTSTSTAGNSILHSLRLQLPASNDRIQLRLWLEQLMASLRALNQENVNATVDHLDNLINQGGIDAVASAVHPVLIDVINRHGVYE